MKPERFNHIAGEAVRCKRLLDKRGSIRRNELPKVTFEEHKHLTATNPKVARFTRCFDYGPNEWIEDVNRMAPARRPVIREIWVGARSLGCVGEDDMPEGHQHSQIEQEDQAELTDLVTMLYDNPEAFDAWLENEITARITESRKWGRKWVNNHIIRQHMKRLVLEDCPRHSKTGEVVKCMITDDDTGDLRPVRVGDTLTVAHGSNENLDALYMDEPNDPRADDDSLIRDLLRDRVNPNSDFEQDMLNNPDMAIPSEDDDLADNELYLRRVANHLASKLVERNPRLEPDFLTLREKAYLRILKAHQALATDHEGRIIAGSFRRPKDLWDDQESRLRTLSRSIARRRKAAPAPVDWDVVRGR